MKTNKAYAYRLIWLIGFLSISELTNAVDYPTCVYTPNNSIVYAWVYDEMSREDIEEWAEWVELNYPDAVMLSEASRRYNCHAYAWYVYEGGDTVWINDPSPFWIDSSYVQVNSEAAAGKVYYGADADHSSITASQSGWHISKWGQGPLMKHAAADCPFDADNLTYYVRDNPAASVAGFSVIDGHAEWKTSSEHMTTGYIIEGSAGPNGPWTPAGADAPPGAGWHSIGLSGADFSCFRLIEVDNRGRRIVHGIARAGQRRKIEKPQRAPVAVLREKLAEMRIERRNRNDMKYGMSGAGRTCYIFSPDSFRLEVERYVADYWRDEWDYNVVVDVIDSFPSHPDDFRAALKAAIADRAAGGALYFHLVGDANDWREFDGELTSSLWIGDWEQIRQNYLSSGYPAGGQQEKDIIPTFVYPDTMPRHRNTSFLTPYILSDLPYADTDDDGVPDVVVTRWPANSAIDVMRLAYKMQNYNNGYVPDYQRFQTAFYVGDRDHDGIGDGAYARGVADGVEALLPPEHGIIRLYESDCPYDAERVTAAADLWNNGLPELVIMLSSYSNRSWPCNFFDQTCVTGAFHMGLIEHFSNHTPLVISGSCDAADFARTEDSDFGPPIAERFLLEEDKGTVAWLGPSVGSWQCGDDAVVRYTIEEIFIDLSRPMAESWLAAMQRVFSDYGCNPSVMRTAITYVFLGDPLSRLCPVAIMTDVSDEVETCRTPTLEQNTPNPFNPATRITFITDRSGHVTLKVYNLEGKSVCTVLDKDLTAGSYTVIWRGLDDVARPVASGVYFYRLVTGEGIRTRKMVLLR